MIATRDNLTDLRPHSFAAPRLDTTRPEDLIGLSLIHISEPTRPY